METKEADGLTWVAGPDDSHLTYLNHEPFLLPTLQDNLPPGGVFLDVGAHLGRYTLRLASLASHVYAVEPRQTARHLLLTNLHRNNITNVTVIPYAAWDSETELLMTDEAASSRVTTDGNSSVDAIPLDEVVPAPVDLIKMDIEGAEVNALRGMAKLLSTHPTLVIEIHNTGEEVRELLEDYDISVIGHSGEQEYFLCK